jgi:aspartate carbamoyltransferase regulatory subunit
MQTDTMNQTFLVSAIKNGTVIDHITAGQALRIINLLALEHSKNTITIGMNLPSKRMGSKDLIKIENRVLTETEANEIVVFAPEATINLIQDFKVTKKVSTHLPKLMRRVFACPNKSCITQAEPIESCFYIKEHKKNILLTCHYCEKEFDRDQVKVTI